VGAEPVLRAQTPGQPPVLTRLGETDGEGTVATVHRRRQAENGAYEDKGYKRRRGKNGPRHVRQRFPGVGLEVHGAHRRDAAQAIQDQQDEEGREHAPGHVFSRVYGISAENVDVVVVALA